MAGAFLVLLFLLIGVLAVACVVYVVQQFRAEQLALREQWLQFANERGFGFFPGRSSTGPAASGAVGEFHVSIDTQVEEATSQKLTRYVIRHPGGGAPKFELKKQSGLQFGVVKSLMGVNDVEIDDPVFDKKILINTRDRDALVQYLSPARREAVLHLFNRTHFRQVRVTDFEVTVSTAEVEKSAEQLAAVTDGLLWFAKTMCDPTEQDNGLNDNGLNDNGFNGAVNDALEERSEGPLDAVPPAPDLIPEPDLAEALIDAPTAPPPIQDAVIEHIDAPRDLPDVESSPEVPVDQESVIADLFDSKRMGFQTDQHFEATYEGLLIRWHGAVDTVRDIRSDSDFVGGGQKVVVLLGLIGDERMRSSRVYAAVQLDTSVEIASGDELAFTGTLVRVDRFTRQLYVADAIVQSG